MNTHWSYLMYFKFDIHHTVMDLTYILFPRFYFTLKMCFLFVHLLIIGVLMIDYIP